MSSVRSRHDRWQDWQLAGLIVIAVLAGGGGVAYGFANLAVQLVAIVVLAFNTDAQREFWARAPQPIRLLVAASLALPLVQLLPLPPAIWQALPGRELAIEAYAAARVEGWHALSVAPHRTLVSLFGLLVPLAIIVVGYSADRDTLLKACLILAALGLASFILGAMQVLGGLGPFYPENRMPGVLFGTFANRNTTGLFLVACLSVVCLVPYVRKRLTPLGTVTLAVLLLLGIVLTQSRSAILLAAIPIGLALLRELGGQKEKRAIVAGMAGIALAGLATIAFLSASGAQGTRLDTIASRFAETDDARSDIWTDSLASAERFAPAGAGMGTFDEVFQVDESLEHMGFKRAGRAHNDFLELAIEAGVAGLLLAAAWILLVIWLSWRARVSDERWTAWTGSTVLSAIALQSVLDYPLRTEAMMAVAAFAISLLLRFGRPTIKGEMT
ncbi:Lipid A core-O-antigen ligase [Altererythrobacter epoxidivorans]|uniref:Lipid A core-O-antigen ligase n=1 Tax=Altererythrobacter epoxidivorans TaxID=361183 RepID=A0A0M4M2B8_9SPHN|nr:O-antigen ligase family protein [Altererythrobacter epoxidivorans]ALE15478.1 Lipid A core-O-antigen ligase [Altererythrobacter epoxidivorans]